MTAADRLRHLAGTTGTAAVLLLSIGSGVTAGAALVDYSGLPTGTATAHLLEDRQQVLASLGSWGGPAKKKQAKRIDEVEEALSEQIVSRLRVEMLSASLSADVAKSAARLKRMRSEEDMILMLL